MAISVTVVEAKQSNADVTTPFTFAFASYTFTAGRLYLIAAGTSVASAPISTVSSITGATAAFTFVNQKKYGASAPNEVRNVEIWRYAPASTVTETLTVALSGGSTDTNAVLLEVTGCKVSGTNGADGIVQSLGAGNALATTGLVTLSAFADSNNRPVGWFQHRTNEVGSAGANFIALQTNSWASPSNGGILEWSSTTADATVDATWTTSSNWGGVAVEIAIAASGSPGSGTAVATGAGVGKSLFNAPGSGTAVATGAGTGKANFKGVGAGTAVATGAATTGLIGSGTAVATGAAVGKSLATGVGSGVAVATGDAVNGSSVPSSGIGSGIAVATGDGVGSSEVRVVGEGVVVATGDGVGSFTFETTAKQINPDDAYISGAIGSAAPRRKGLDQRSPIQESPYKYGSGQVPGGKVNIEMEESPEDVDAAILNEQYSEYNGFTLDQIVRMQNLVREYDDQIAMRQLAAQYEAKVKAQEEDDLTALWLLL